MNKSEITRVESRLKKAIQKEFDTFQKRTDHNVTGISLTTSHLEYKMSGKPSRLILSSVEVQTDADASIGWDVNLTNSTDEMLSDVLDNEEILAKGESALNKQVDGESIERTLQERGARYGDFSGHSKITQGIKAAMLDSPNWTTLTDDKKEALEMVAHKIGRILNGDPEYHDSWHDIIGYVKLVEETLTSD